jgi:hypothetical protein
MTTFKTSLLRHLPWHRQFIYITQAIYEITPAKFINILMYCITLAGTYFILSAHFFISWSLAESNYLDYGLPLTLGIHCFLIFAASFFYVSFISPVRRNIEIACAFLTTILFLLAVLSTHGELSARYDPHIVQAYFHQEKQDDGSYQLDPHGKLSTYFKLRWTCTASCGSILEKKHKKEQTVADFSIAMTKNENATFINIPLFMVEFLWFFVLVFIRYSWTIIASAPYHNYGHSLTLGPKLLNTLAALGHGILWPLVWVRQVALPRACAAVFNQIEGDEHKRSRIEAEIISRQTNTDKKHPDQHSASPRL